MGAGSCDVCAVGRQACALREAACRCTSMGEDFHELSLSAPSARPMALFEVGISPLVLGWLRWSWAGGLRRLGLRCRLLGSHLPRSSV